MNILVGLIEHMGDIVACEPVARFLKDKYPKAHVAWVVREPYRELIDTNPNIDETLIVGCLTEWIILSRHQACDLVVDLHVNYRICPTCRVPLMKTTGNPHVNIHEYFDHGALLEAFSVGAGLPELSGQPRLFLHERHQKSVDNLGLGDGYCVIHRHSNDKQKDWNAACWPPLIQWLNREKKLKVVEIGFGTPPDTKGYSPDYVSMVNQTSLLESAEIIRRAALFIGIDSGPAHLANSVQTPGVVLLGRLGMFRSYTPFTGFYGSDDGRVKMVRNWNGPVREIPLHLVVEATDDVIQFIGRASSTSPTADRVQVREPEVRVRKNPKPDPKRTYPLVLAFCHSRFFFELNEVVKAKPLSRGYDQPRIPGELSLFDPGSPDGMNRQIELAQAHGVTGFCFDYRYCSGKKRLNQPIQDFLRSDIPFPFCFLWSNEIRSKHLEESDQDVIPKLRPSKKDDQTFLRRLLPVFEDPRYIKAGGRPLLLVRQPFLFKDIRETTESWRLEAEQAGFPGIFLVMADEGNIRPYHPREFGFDASYEIPDSLEAEALAPDDISVYDVPEDFKGKLVDYYKFSTILSGRPFPEFKRFKTVVAPWGDAAPKDAQAFLHVNTGHDAYRMWVTKAYLDTFRFFAPEERILFIHSWNGWGEGSNIEPDEKRKRKYLEQTRDAIGDAQRIIQSAEPFNPDLETGFLIDRIIREKEASFRPVFDGLSREAETARINRDQACRDRDDARREKDRIREEFETAKVEFDRVKTELDHARHELGRKDSELDRVRGELVYAREELDGFLKSRSWRMTWPLRFSKKKLKGLKAFIIQR